MKKQVTRLTALLLAVAMSFSLLSTSAWATELPVEETEPAETVEQAETEEVEAMPEEDPDADEAEEIEAMPEEASVIDEAEESEAMPEAEALPAGEPVADEAEEIEEVPEAEGLTQWAAASGTCGANVTWTLNNSGTLTISGTGKMEDYSGSDMPWYSAAGSIQTVMIANGVTSIGNGAFKECSSLSSITIPNSVTSIGEDAFFYCSSLNSITIPGSVTRIGADAFNGTPWRTNQLKDNMLIVNHMLLEYTGSDASVTIPVGVTRIGAYAFGSCSSLSSVAIPSSVTRIDANAFYNCSSLNSITIPSNVTSIGDSAFSECSNLTSITIPGSVVSIGESAFSYCSSLNSITIPGSVTHIADGTFEDCENLSSVTIPNSIRSIGNDAFRDCSSLSSMKIPNSVTSIGDGAFSWCSLSSIVIPSSVTRIGEQAFSCCDSLSSIYFKGNAPSIGEDMFEDDTLTAYYPAGNSTWASSKRQNYGGTVTWKTWNPSGLATPMLTAVSNVSTGVVVRWGKVSNAAGYYICRKTSTSNWVRIATIKNANTVIYGDTAVKSQNGIAYTYTVRAYSNGALSDYNKTGKTVVRLTTSAAPSVSPGSKQMTVKWGKNASATGYQIEYAANSSFTGYKLSTVGGTTAVSKVITNLSADKTYYVRIRTYKTYNKVNYYSDWSSAVSVKIPLTTPTLISATNVTTGVVFQWGKVTNAAGYYVYRKTGSGNWAKIATIKSGSTVVYGDATVKSQNGAAYTYTVRAYNSNGISDYNKTGKTVVRLGTPVISKLSNSGSKKMTVKWGKNGSATGYQIQYATNSSFSGYKLVTVKGAASVSKVIRNLTKRKTYYVRVRSYKTYNKVNHYSAWSSTKSVKISK